MRDRSFAQTSKNIPQTSTHPLSNPSNLFQTLKEEPIKPWEMAFFSIDELIQQPNRNEDVFSKSISNSTILASTSPQTNRHPSPTDASLKTQQSKNKNVLKFVVKLLRDYPSIVRESFGQQEVESLQRLQKYIHDLFKCHKGPPGEHNINQDHLKWLLKERGNEETRVRSRGARLALRRILCRHMGELALRNSRCQSKLVYMNALKVYQLRCFNSITSLRLQS